ncbi:Cell wall mannoprotein PIR1 [Candida viswanathii]|uniref:Cell wall mannoprotein PIR1 n=1 Tax=Candida viswanathii TaxID=5486 RepID=A0A367XLP0_9ASCO|nr:Cell wall mannoprotein PIR1 [Candida viswanathii]
MKFTTTSAAAFTLSLFVVAQPGVVPVEDCNKCEVDTFDGEFALSVKELGFDYKNYKFLDLVYEIEDGQLEHGSRPDQLYPISLCKYCSLVDHCGKDCGEDGVVRLKEHPKISKRGGVSVPEPGCDEPYCKICKDDCIWLFNLCDGVLTDKNYATGEIVANHQLQFDKLSQIDAFRTCGFSITYQYGNYLLALDHKTVFWHCKVDDYGLYKIYDKKIGAQCAPVQLIVLQGKHCKKRYDHKSFPAVSS